MHFLPYEQARLVDQALVAWRSLIRKRHGRVSWVTYSDHERAAWGVGA